MKREKREQQSDCLHPLGLRLKSETEMETANKCEGLQHIHKQPEETGKRKESHDRRGVCEWDGGRAL